MTEPAPLKRVLILDDDGDFRRLVKVQLGRLLPDVEVVEYDPVAMGAPDESFNWSVYDALILDYHLSLKNVTGLDILQTHRKNPSFPATIMLTGAGNEEVAARALNAGIYHYLSKEKFSPHQLKDALLDAVAKHQQQRPLVLERANFDRTFDKARFFQELDHDIERNTGVQRVLLLIKLDDHALMEHHLGVIVRDNVMRHIAKESYLYFKNTSADPCITRLDDVSVGMLINEPGPMDPLPMAIDGLCGHLAKNLYRFESRVVRFSVSIGVILLPGRGRSAEALLQAAGHGSKLASAGEGNSHHILTSLPQYTAQAEEEDSIPDPILDLEEDSIPDSVLDLKKGNIPDPVLDLEEDCIPDPVLELEEDSIPDPVLYIEQPAAQTPRVPAYQEPAQTPSLDARQTPTPQPPPVPASAISKVASQKPAAPATPAPQVAAKPATEVAPPTAQPTPASVQIAAPLPANVVEAQTPDKTLLSASAFKIERAFANKRVTQLFRPVIPLNSEVQKDDRTIYDVGLQLAAADGSILDEDAIYQMATAPTQRKFIDRWQLRETVGQIVHHEPDQYLFLLHMSEASLADPELFTWLRTLVTGLDNQRIGQSMVLELAAADFTALEKPAIALMTFLRKSHGFRFAFGQLRSSGDVAIAAQHNAHFEFVLMHGALLKEMSSGGATSGDSALLEKLHGQGQLIVITGIRDAVSTTDAIMLGADLATGPFMGDPLQQLGSVPTG